MWIGLIFEVQLLGYNATKIGFKIFLVNGKLFFYVYEIQYA